MDNLFLSTIGTFVTGAILSLLLKSKGKIANRVSNISAITGSILGIIMSGSLLIGRFQYHTIIQTSFPLLNISINVDQLSAFFILVISTVSLTSSIYGLSYMQKFIKQYSVGSFGFFYNLFIASLILVSSASNSLYFLIVWEIMSITSYFLVIFENKKSENINAGFLYLVMTHLGTAFILLTFLLLFMFTGSFEFAVIKQQANNIPLLVKNVIFVLALVGFGTKAGIIPLHIWLPRAHPAAPSHVSALMSGVMIKTAILMMIRIYLDLMPSGASWWGIVVLIIGAISSLLGVLYALSEHDIKKLLAYHSVENIGIILMGLGSAMIFYSLGMIPLAILGLVAALYHTMNHAIFKSLLFLGAGSVVLQTHSHNMEEYGGLIKRMPYTAVFFLIGAVAISALPPFNGFASEWATYQALFAGVIAQSTLIKGSFVLAIASLAFTGGLAAACFVKAFAVTFLAKPRSEAAKNSVESPMLMNVGMAILALLCLVLGIFSGSVVPEIIAVTTSLSAMSNYTPAIATSPQSVTVSQGFASLNLPAVFIALAGVLTIVMTLVYIKTRNQKVSAVDVWDCGAPPLNSRAEITSTGFARALIVMFGSLMRPTKHTIIENNISNLPYYPSSKTVNLEVPNVYETKLYRPVHTILSFIASKVSIVQNGNVNQYLMYIFVTLIGLLLWSNF